MRKVLCALFGIIKLANCFSQNSITIEADYILDFPGSFATLKNNQVETNYFFTEFDSYKNDFVTRKVSSNVYPGIDSLMRMYRNKEENLIKLTDLTSMPITELKQYRYDFESYTNSDKTAYYSLEIVNSNYALLSIYVKTAAEKDFSVFSQVFLNIIPVTINNKYRVYYFFRNGFQAGYIIPTKNKILVKISDNSTPQLPVKPVDEKSLIFRSRKYFPIGEIVKEKDKYGIKLSRDSNFLIAPVYDSIQQNVHNFIVAYKRDSIFIFFRNGEKVDIPNLRAIAKEDGLTVLSDTTIYWINEDGERTLEKPKELLRYYCGTVPHTSAKIYKRQNKFKITTYTGYSTFDSTVIVLQNLDNYKSIHFLNGSNFFGANANDNYYAQSLDFRNYLILTTKDGRKGMIKYDFSNNTYVFLLSLDNYTFLPAFINQPLFYKKNKLWGVWPFSTEPRYTFLSSFSKGFARFSLPNQQLGWLDKNGKEYLDGE